MRTYSRTTRLSASATTGRSAAVEPRLASRNRKLPARTSTAAVRPTTSELLSSALSSGATYVFRPSGVLFHGAATCHAGGIMNSITRGPALLLVMNSALETTKRSRPCSEPACSLPYGHWLAANEKIGRASCRERVESEVVEVERRKNREREQECAT